MGNVFGIADSKGDSWRKMKKAVTSSFSLPKIKKYIHQYTKTCKEMVEYLEDPAKNGEVVHCTDFIKMLSINVFGAVGFGMDVNAFKDKNSEFKRQGDALTVMWRWLALLMTPNIAALFRIDVYDQKAKRWFISIVRRNIQNRKKDDTAGENDILGSLIKLHDSNPEEVTEEIINKTVLQFIFDGYLTTADSMTGILALVVTHPEVQAKLREEIDAVFDVKDDGDIDITDNDVIGMGYLDNVILEGNRLLAVGITTRQVTKPWKIPGTDITLPIGVGVMIPISSFQKDPDFWENPKDFIPERFDAENKSKIKTGTYQPLGQGPRQCLGNNYVKFKTKMMLIYLLRFFEVENCENLPKQFELDNRLAFFQPKGGLKVKFHKRDI